MYMILFYLMYISTITYSLSMDNWFLMWIMAEMNLISFLPLLIDKSHIKFFTIPTAKYFLIQAFSSMLLVMSIIFMYVSINFMINNMIHMTIMIAIMIKLGMFPFHYWYVKLMMNSNWINCLILSTAQKLIPFLIISNITKKIMPLIILMIFINSMFSTMLGLNQTLLKILLSYSSINSISWMLTNMIIEELFFIMFFTIYFIINFNLMMFFYSYNMNTLNSIYLMKNKLMFKIFILFNMVSLACMPPMLGFLLKWITLNLLKLNFTSYFLLMILMAMSSITLLYYFYILIPLMNFFNLNKKMFLNKILKINFQSLMLYYSLWFLMLKIFFI